MSARDGDEKKQRFQDFFRGLKDYEILERDPTDDRGHNLLIPLIVLQLVDSIIIRFQVNYPF